MIPYVLGQVRRILREALAPAASPRAWPEQSQRVTLSRTRYLVALNGTVHRVRRDGVCDCGGTRLCPCPAIPLVRDYLVAGGSRPLGRHPDTWPRTWIRVPPLCPVCSCPTRPDRDLDSRAGPGWRCTLTGGEHFWLVRTEPLRRYRRNNPPKPTYPWWNSTDKERQAWLDEHSHPPRCSASSQQSLAPSPKENIMPKFQIFYARQPTFHPSGKYGTPLLTLQSLQTSHVFVREVEAQTMNGAVWNMQGEVWSPNGEARSLIESLGLGHTSMSVGDVAQDSEGVYWEFLGASTTLSAGLDGWRAIEEKARGQTQTP